MNNYTGHKFIFFTFAILIAVFGLLFIASRAKAFNGDLLIDNSSETSYYGNSFSGCQSFKAVGNSITEIEFKYVGFNGCIQPPVIFIHKLGNNPTPPHYYFTPQGDDVTLSSDAYPIIQYPNSGSYWITHYATSTYQTNIGEYYAVCSNSYGECFMFGWDNTNPYQDGSFSADSNVDISMRIYGEYVPPTNNYITYYGANPVYILTNTDMDLPVVYNVCDDWEEGKNYYIKLFDDSNNTIGARQKINTCSGTIRYNPYSWLWDLSKTANFAIFEENDETIPANWIVKSNSFILTVYTQILSENNFIKYDIDSPLYIKTDTIGSTTVPIAYDVCSDINFATGEINLYDYDTGIAIGSANYPLSSFGGCSGVFNAVIDWGAYSNISHTAQFSYINGGSKLANGDIFQLIFYSTDIPDTIALASDAHNQACTASEWTLAETEYLVDLRCRAVETFIETSNTITKDLKYQLSELASRFKNLFPFNFAQQIKLCWELSETADMPEKLDFLGSDNNGNIAIPVLSGLTGNTTTTAVIWGNGIFNTSTTTKEIFDKSRELSTWVLKGIFIIYIFYIGRKFYFELIGKNTNEIDND